MSAALCVTIFAALSLGAHCSTDVRLVDEAGGLANVGLLQVATEAGFGTVCGANAAAADATWPALHFTVPWPSQDCAVCLHAWT